MNSNRFDAMFHPACALSLRPKCTEFNATLLLQCPAARLDRGAF